MSNTKVHKTFKLRPKTKEILGKITKSVEEKITEIKSRNHEEGSPLHKAKSDTPKSPDLKTVADSKENSSVSDSEDLSESSISKTCGILSTTEGVEMSSDEDTPSLEKDKKEEKYLSVTPNAFKHKFRFFRKNHREEGTVKTNDLSKLYNINTENVEQALPEDSEGVENAVDALEETNIKSDRSAVKISDEEILKTVAQKIENMEVDNENVINIKEVPGSEIRERYFDCTDEKTVFAPTGFVDLRSVETKNRQFSNYLSVAVLLVSILIYVVIQYYSPYSAGLAAGLIISFIIFKTYLKLYPRNSEKPVPTETLPSNKIFEIQAVKEYQPMEKYEGWLNEYPDVYNHETYHISRTQSVFLRLQGNLLRISHAKNKIAKRAMWNEPEIKANFTQHRIYNLIGAKVYLSPDGLTKIRQWSKKYPICITLAKDQLCFDQEVLSKMESDLLKDTEGDNTRSADKGKLFTSSGRDKKGFNKFRKKEYHILAQRFSKLTEGEEFDLDSDSRASTPSADISDAADSPAFDEEELLNIKEERNEEEANSITEDWSLCSPSHDSNTNEIKLYLFGRTDREKEDWFRRLCTATHKGVGLTSMYSSNSDIKDVSDNLVEAAQIELEYLRYMSLFKIMLGKILTSQAQELVLNLYEYFELEKRNGGPLEPLFSVQEPSRRESKFGKESEKGDAEQLHDQEETKDDNILWLNALIGRVLFDCFRNASFIDKVKDRIQRKLSTIKLPYFIEELLIPELSLGKTAPLIRRTGRPYMDEKGLWIDLDVNYEGMIVLTLQTKINLMRLKNPQAYDKSTMVKSAIYHSDVDDSAESSTDEEGLQELPNTPQETPSGSSHGKKNLMKMVDRLAESKFFQAATENRYIKKAMEGVSNTDLRLTVEVKSIIGTLVLNIPPPPTDRIWIGFRPVPELSLSAKPIVGERNISYIMVTSWIEKKLVQEFQKVLVIPNMEDLLIHVMNPKLPD